MKEFSEELREPPTPVFLDKYPDENDVLGWLKINQDSIFHGQLIKSAINRIQELEAALAVERFNLNHLHEIKDQLKVAEMRTIGYRENLRRTEKQLSSEKECHAAWESEHLRQAAEMEAQLMECKKDAERYRFVSGDILSRYDKKDKSYSLDWDHRGKCSGESDEWPEIDDVIDAAISQKES